LAATTRTPSQSRPAAAVASSAAMLAAGPALVAAAVLSAQAWSSHPPWRGEGQSPSARQAWDRVGQHHRGGFRHVAEHKGLPLDVHGLEGCAVVGQPEPASSAGRNRSRVQPPARGAAARTHARARPPGSRSPGPAQAQSERCRGYLAGVRVLDGGGGVDVGAILVDRSAGGRAMQQMCSSASRHARGAGAVPDHTTGHQLMFMQPGSAHMTSAKPGLGIERQFTVYQPSHAATDAGDTRTLAPYAVPSSVSHSSTRPPNGGRTPRSCMLLQK